MTEQTITHTNISLIASISTWMRNLWQRSMMVREVQAIDMALEHIHGHEDLRGDLQERKRVLLAELRAS